MALGAYRIHFERPAETSLGDVMNDIRSWLDNHKIESTKFITGRTEHGALAIDIGFESQDEARLFERDFELGASVT